MVFGGIQGPEILIILLVLLLIFGPTRLPQLARGVGQAIREFRKASQGMYDDSVSEGAKKVKEGKEVDAATLERLAKKLGVDTEGKSEDELKEEILKVAREKGILKEDKQEGQS